MARTDTGTPLFAGERTGVVQGEVVVAIRSLDPPAGDHRRRQSLRLGAVVAPALRQWLGKQFRGYRFIEMCQQRRPRRPICLRTGHGSAIPPAPSLLRF